MKEDDTSVLDDLVAKAINVGADALEVEYKDGREEVYARKGNTGIGIAMLASDGPEVTALRRQLHIATRRKRRVHIESIDYKLSVREYESFGEIAHRIEIVAD